MSEQYNVTLKVIKRFKYITTRGMRLLQLANSEGFYV